MGSAVCIIHRINRQKNYSACSKDYEFSRLSVQEHWRAGSNDVRRTLRHRGWQTRLQDHTGVSVFDLTLDAED